MKLSILNLARIGMAVFCLNLCPSLQASQENIHVALKSLNSTGFDCKAREVILPSKLVKDGIVPNSVAESQELWRFNAIFLKDALEIIALGSSGNEIVVISDNIINNAQNIGNFLKLHTQLEDAANEVQFLIVEQAFTLYAFTIASQFDPEQVPAIESLLEQQNENLFRTLSLIIKAKSKARELLRNSLDFRLAILKEVSLGFVNAVESEDFTNAYKSFNKSLFADQEVGALIGWTLFLNH
jgi:hypothetical protein